MYMEDARDHPTADRCHFRAGRFLVHNGYAPEWAVLNYTMFRISGDTFFTVRNEHERQGGKPHRVCDAILGARHWRYLVAGQTDHHSSRAAFRPRLRCGGL